jgi:glycine/D-amino acid oxidase-like deaminating enzyme
MVSSVWTTLLKTHPGSLCIESNTPVTAITTSPDSSSSSDRPYLVHTPRGTIAARHVLHATNAYAGHLIPSLKSCIAGARGHMTASPSQASRPAPFAMAGAQNPGERSWSVVYDGGYDYCSQRPLRGDFPGGGGGEVLLGGGFFRSVEKGLDMIAQWDDGEEAIDPLTMAHVHGIGRTVFDEWDLGGGKGREWCGIFAVTGDTMPLVGRVDESLTGRRISTRPPEAKDDNTKEGVRPGEWISAGYHGDGMAMAWLSGTAVGAMIAGVDEDDVGEFPGRPGGKVKEWFPDEMRITPERVRGRADLVNLAKTL